MLGEFLLTVCFALGCAPFGCGGVHLVAKIQSDRQDAAEDMSLTYAKQQRRRHAHPYF